MAKTNKNPQDGYLKETRDFAEDLTGALRSRADNAIQQTEKGVYSAEKMVRRYIRENPERAVFIAMGIGAMVALGLSEMIRNALEE